MLRLNEFVKTALGIVEDQWCDACDDRAEWTIMDMREAEETPGGWRVIRCDGPRKYFCDAHKREAVTVRLAPLT